MLHHNIARRSSWICQARDTSFATPIRDRLQRNTTPRWPDTVAAYCLCSVIALVPFPFGSMDPRVIAVWILLLSVMIGMASLRPITSRDVLFMFGFATIGASWGFVVVEQMSHAPIFAGQLIDS